MYGPGAPECVLTRRERAQAHDPELLALYFFHCYFNLQVESLASISVSVSDNGTLPSEF
jgi:hypothetical protein